MAESRRPIPNLGGSCKNHAKIAATFIDERNGDSDGSGDKNRSNDDYLEDERCRFVSAVGSKDEDAK